MKILPNLFIEELKKKEKKRWHLATISCFLALFVAVGVFWQLRMVGITMTDEACCGKVEHVHTEEVIPPVSGVYPMAQKLEEAALLEKPEEYEPKAGDLVFFDRNHDGMAEQMGIVSETDEENAGFSVIEGDCDGMVAEKSAAASDGDIFGYCDIASAQAAYSEVPDKYEEKAAGADIVTVMRPMMQSTTKDDKGDRVPDPGVYSQLYIDKEIYIRAAVDDEGNSVIEVQVPDEYAHFHFADARIHRHEPNDLSTNPANEKAPGVNCECTDTIKPAYKREETTEDGRSYVVLGFKKEDVNADVTDLRGWCIVTYYDLDDAGTEMYPATFFDYTYAEDGRSVNSGINSAQNYRPGTENNRLGVGLKDYYHTGGKDRLGNYTWNANVYVTDKDGNQVMKDADANNGQDANDLIGYPIIQGLLREATGDNYSEILWNVDEPGLFSAEPSVGKTIYSDYDLEFYNIGDYYVLNNVYNKTTGKYSTEGVYNKANNGNVQKGGNFWPLDDQKNGDWFDHIYDKDAIGTYHNWYFGMRYDVEFNLTPEYVGDLSFLFSGDDMWVLLDGELILDLGGLHSAYPMRYKVDADSSPLIEKPMGNTWEFESENAWPNKVNLRTCLNDNDSGKHVITILYMERGGYDSNCYMEFKLPNVDVVPRVITPNAELSLKKLDEKGNALEGAEFQLCKDEEGTDPAAFYTDKKFEHPVENGELRSTKDELHAYGITDGTYYLFERKAPDGYERLDGPIVKFSVKDGIITECESYYGSVKTTVSGVSIGLQVTNFKAGERTIDVKAVKKWNDDEKDHSGDSVTVHLCRNGEPMEGGEYTVTLNEANGWTYVWQDLPTSDKDGKPYTYSVTEDAVEGYGTEYSAQWRPGVSAWMKADEIVAGETYILTNGKDQAMYTNTDGATVFSTGQYPATTSGNYPVSVSGDELTAEEIVSQMLWKAEANGKYFQFLNQWSAESEKVAVKYLRIENTRVDGDTFKTANANYKSNFSYTPKSGLTGFNNGTTTGTQYRVRFENNKFASGNSSSGDNIVPFVLKNTPDIYEITITNTPEYEVELPETGSTGRFFTHWEEFC